MDIIKEIKISIKSKPYFDSFNVKVYEFKDIEFGIATKKNKYFEIIHIRSGLGFNGNGERNLKSIESAYKKIGPERWNKTIKNSKAVDENIKKNKEFDIHNSTFFDKLGQLNKIMNVKLKTDIIGIITGRKCLDVIDLDYQLCTPDGISTNDFITEKYGKETGDLVKELI